jgi:hypothetical protein
MIESFGLLNLLGRLNNPIFLFFHENSMGIVYNRRAQIASAESYKDPDIEGEEYGSTICM